MAVVTLHHELRLADAGGGIAGGVLDMQLDRPADQPALGIHLLGPELGAMAHLRADFGGGAGERERHADADRRLAARVTQYDGRRHRPEAHADCGTACELGCHGVLPDGSAVGTVSPRWRMRFNSPSWPGSPH